jgi:hypothetical protein
MGPTGPAGTGTPGATGASASATYDPSKASTYRQNDIIYYNGNLYSANTNSPTGPPGDAGSGYTQLTNSSRVGRGLVDVAPPYNPVDAASYQPGQLITYNGQLYQVLNAPPRGTPGSSRDYMNLSGGGITGPAGPTGSMGPAGPFLL